MKALLYKALRTPAGIVKRTLPLMMVGVFFVSCNRDLLYMDDLLLPETGNELLVYKYQAETLSTKKFQYPDKPFNVAASIPEITNQRHELRISKSGEVESFTEHLPTSEVFIYDPFPETETKVKYEHFKNGTLSLYDADRNLLSEFEMPELMNEYNEIFQDLIDPERTDMHLFNLLNFDASDWYSDNTLSLQRVSTSADAYVDHPDYEVIRSKNVDERTGEEFINEIIAHKPTNIVKYISGYTMTGQAIMRTTFGYKNGSLVSTYETIMDNSDPNNPYEQTINTKYENFTFNLNLD